MMMSLKDCHLTFYLDAEATDKHKQNIYAVDAIPHDEDKTAFRKIAYIFNWEASKNPSIKIPYYIDALTLDEICEVVMRQEAPDVTV